MVAVSLKKRSECRGAYVAECRGPEVRDVLTALNTGHEGGWATLHANSPGDVPARLTALGALAGLDEAAVAAQAASALDAVVHLSLIHISEPTRPLYISYAVFCLKKKSFLLPMNQLHL